MNIYLDDIRNPVGVGWVICRDGDSFSRAVLSWDVASPLVVSFDHDLGDGCADDGYSLVKWLCDYLMEFCGTTILALVDVRVHSANPVGRDNIEKYWDLFRRHCV